jgi:hypothetical protein
MRYALFAVLLACALGVQAFPQQRGDAQAPDPPAQAAATQPQRKIPCKTPENASMCYWTRGRLNFANGNPSYRIWKVGTTRILGVYSGPGSQRVDPLDNEHPEFPANLAHAYVAEYGRNVALNRDTPYLLGPVFAEFEVCPLEPDTPGTMQAACIESAKNIFVDFSKRGYR